MPDDRSCVCRDIEIMRLDTENKILSDTVKWMHDAIWEMIREQKGYTDKNVAEILNSLENDDSLKNSPEDTATAKPPASEHTQH